MDKGSLIRTIILVLALVNQVLSVAGYPPLPISDEDVNLLVSTGATVIVAVWTWWKNNYISKKGQAQKQALKDRGLD